MTASDQHIHHLNFHLPTRADTSVTSVTSVSVCEVTADDSAESPADDDPSCAICAAPLPAYRAHLDMTTCQVCDAARTTPATERNAS